MFSVIPVIIDRNWSKFLHADSVATFIRSGMYGEGTRVS